MRIRQVEIERFRGIKELKWCVDGDIVCLIGPGDATKTTILDAIELALSPRWNIPFDDTDFYDADTSEPIVIRVTVGDLPEEFKSDAKYGLEARGWSPSGELHDEPEQEDEMVLTIQLRVEPSLEQSWAVVNDRNPEGKHITAKDREKLGCARLGDYLDRHFSWSRGSILSRLTGEADSLSGILAEAGRAARSALADVPHEKLSSLRQAALRARQAGKEMGVAPTAEYKPHLDVQAVSVGLGGVSLHDGEVPLRRAGLGTRRLLAVAMQREVAKAGGPTLIDEVEHGLEPHRIRRLIRVLSANDGALGRRHVLMTTHSPVVLGELNAQDIRIVRHEHGVTKVYSVPEDLQPIVRKASEAFLARKVIVCEGKTELGFCRGLDAWWSRDGRPSFALAGIALADGGGSEATRVTKALADLSYDVLFLGDSDQPIDPDQNALEQAGVKVLLWDGDTAIEQRIGLDLPWDGVVDVVNLAMNVWGEDSVRDAIATRLEAHSERKLTNNPSDWLGLGPNDDDFRKAIGDAAKKKGWFKRVDLAEDLSEIVIKYYVNIKETDLGQKIAALQKWAHSDE
ncbi:MAG TPA: hypothetical protein ENJ37_08375 [Deltaproteobacteria bacterium]|nr:hypothetical protein [Deltaproteobacteria bacterium]